MNDLMRVGKVAQPLSLHHPSTAGDGLKGPVLVLYQHAWRKKKNVSLGVVGT